MTLTIGKLSSGAGVKIPTIRFYEEIGLLPRALRTDSDRRIYGEADVARLAFIKHARELGFPIDAIKTLLDLSAHPEKTCDDANNIAAEQLAAVERKITQLESLRSELSRMVSVGCSGPAANCRVIEALAGHTVRS